jgi:hypothetical protein
MMECVDNPQPLGHTLRRPCSAPATVVQPLWTPPFGLPSVWRQTWVGTYQGGAMRRSSG